MLEIDTLPNRLVDRNEEKGSRELLAILSKPQYKPVRM